MWQVLRLKSSRSSWPALAVCTKLIPQDRNTSCLQPRALHRFWSTNQLNSFRSEKVGQRSICTEKGKHTSSCSNGTRDDTYRTEISAHPTGRQREQGRYSWFWGSLFAAGGIIGGLTISTVFADDKDEGLEITSGGQNAVTSSPEKEKLDIEGQLSLSQAIEIGRDLAQRIKDETGSPGLTVAVSVDGKTVWSEGLGYADVENRLPCKPETVLRIASISKSITMAAVAKLWEQGDIDLDKPVQHYVSEFPEKTWKGKKVSVTTRQLLCHMGGIRHYDRTYMTEKQADSEAKVSSADSQTAQQIINQNFRQSGTYNYNEMDEKEYFIKEKYDSVTKSLGIFKDDPLVNKPGTEYFYTTHGWTLISAVVEKAAKVPFEKYLKGLLDELGMENTFMEDNELLIYNRGRHYVKNKNGRLANAPYTDLSYKWAGGGLISNVLDLVKFGNAMLYSYQATGFHGNGTSSDPPGFLKPETMKEMWSKVDKTDLSWGGLSGGGYGLGWGVWDMEQKYGCCKGRQCIVAHTGAAVGGSSVLLILPSKSDESNQATNQGGQPKGIVVSMLVNMVSVGLMKTAFEIARTFDSIERTEV